MNKCYNTCLKAMFILIIIYVQNGFAESQFTLLTENWPPYNYQENGQVVGISTELVEALFQSANITYKIYVNPWARSMHMTQTTPNTALFTCSRTLKREKLFKWVGPLFPKNLCLYRLKKRNDIVVNTLNDLKNYQIGVINNGSVHEYLLNHGFAKTKLQPVATSEQNLHKLFYQRVDLIVGTEATLIYRMQKKGYKFSDLSYVYTLITKEKDYYLAFNLNTKNELINRLQNIFDSLLKKGLRDEITQKYFGKFHAE